jgi:hypothetical protein
MKNSILDALAQFTQNEKELINDLWSTPDSSKKEFKPRESSVQNILNYSKALSVRKSKHLDSLQFVLN